MKTIGTQYKSENPLARLLKNQATRPRYPKSNRTMHSMDILYHN